MKNKKIIILLTLLIISESLFAITHEQLSEKLILNNPSLQNSKKDIELANLDLKDAKAAYQPQIEFLGTGTYMVNPPIGKIVVSPDDYVTGQTGTSGSMSSLSAIGLDGPITVYQGMEDTYYNFNIKITQPLYTWDKINTSVELYDKVVSIKSIKSNSLFKQLNSELETREAAIFYIKMMEKNLYEQKEISNELISYVEEAYNNELLVEQDLLEAQIKAKQIDIGIKKLEKEKMVQLSQIAKLTNSQNLTSADIEYRVNEKNIAKVLNMDKSQIIEKSTNPNSDNIKMLNLLTSIQNDQVKIAENSIYYKPDLALQIETGYSGYRLPLVEKGWYTSDQGSLNFTIAIKSTIWDGGKKLNDIDRKKIEEEKSEYDVIDAKNQIIQTINENLYTIQLTSANIEYELLNSEIIKSKIDSLEKEYEYGFGDKASILKEELNLKASEIEIYQQKLERAQAYYIIMYLMS